MTGSFERRSAPDPSLPIQVATLSRSAGRTVESARKFQIKYGPNCIGQTSCQFRRGEERFSCFGIGTSAPYCDLRTPDGKAYRATFHWNGNYILTGSGRFNAGIWYQTPEQLEQSRPVYASLHDAYTRERTASVRNVSRQRAEGQRQAMRMAQNLFAIGAGVAAGLTGQPVPSFQASSRSTTTSRPSSPPRTTATPRPTTTQASTSRSDRLGWPINASGRVSAWNWCTAVSLDGTKVYVSSVFSGEIWH